MNKLIDIWIYKDDYIKILFIIINIEIIEIEFYYFGFDLMDDIYKSLKYNFDHHWEWILIIILYEYRI